MHQDYVVHKTRPDDFIAELGHICDAVEGRVDESPITLERGMESMLVIAAAHKSAKRGRAVTIDYSKGYSTAALR